jgi:hypothetical protein
MLYVYDENILIFMLKVKNIYMYIEKYVYIYVLNSLINLYS